MKESEEYSMPEYRIARSYEEMGYKIIESSIVEENGKKYAEAAVKCGRCGGTGRIPCFGHIDDGICFACNGVGRFFKKIRIYTEAERAKMDAAAARKKERDLEKKRAEATSKRQAWLDKYNIADGNIFVVAGCNTYEIKDELKAQGAKFYSGLGWFFGTATAPNEPIATNEFLFHCTVEDMFYWTEFGAGPYFKEGALDDMQKKIAEIVAKKNKEQFGASQHVGEVGARLRNMKATFVSVKCFEGKWGMSLVYSFDVDGNIMTWFTQSQIDNSINIGDTVILTGTVKAHTEYQGILQTQLSRCIVKKGE